MVDRRGVLKGAGAGLAAVASTTGASSAAKIQTKAAAEAELEQLAAKYEEPAAVDELVHFQTELLRELVENDVLERAEIDDLDELTVPDATGEGEELARFAPAGERWTPVVRIFRSVERGHLTISLFPELDDGYAALKTSPPGEFDGQSDIETFGNPSDVQPNACWCGCECEENCGDCEYECCDVSCTRLCEVCGGCDCVPCQCGACCAGQC